MSENKLHFETLQLHVGQEEADPYLTTLPTQLPALA